MNGATLVGLQLVPSVTVDDERRLAHIAGNPSWQEILDVLSPYGLAPMTPTVPSAHRQHPTDLKLFPICTVFGGSLWFDRARVAEILPLWRRWVQTLPEAATSSFDVTRGEPDVHVTFSFIASPECGDALIEPLREAAHDDPQHPNESHQKEAS